MAEINYSVDRGVALITWQMSTSPMNVLNDTSIPAFETALNQAYTDPAVNGIIITSAKPEFVAGADLKMILRHNDGEPEAMLEVSAELNRIFRTMEVNGKPVVAAMNGTALGGGYEICLATHYRVALDNSKALIGLVEVTLGLLPGGGGTQRLPRMLGIQAALPLLLEGKKVGVREAKDIGFIDAIAPTPEALLDMARAFIAANPHPVKPWDQVDKKTGRILARDNFSVPGGNVQSPVGAQVFATGTALLLDKTKGNYPAPLAIMACVYEGLQVNMDRALAVEARHFVQVATSRVAKNMIETLFLGLNEANKGASRPKGQPKTEVKKLGILGAGTSGAAIAYTSAGAGIEVILNAVTAEAAQRCKESVQKQVQKAVQQGKIAAQKADELLARIRTRTDSADFKGCDLLIEAVAEETEINTPTTEAEFLLDDKGIFGTSTTAFPISGRAQALSRPQNFVGIHFVAPADKSTLLELIRTDKTADYALALAMDYARKIRKTPIVVNDAPGFYIERCAGTYLTEGLYLLLDGVSPVLIENAGINAGMPAGPLATHDERGIAPSLSALLRAGAFSADERAARLLEHMKQLGRLGQTTKQGFYDYPTSGLPKQLWTGLADHYPANPEQPTQEEVKTRLLYRQALEALRCLEEGVVQSRLDGNLGSVLGWGFPAYTGGALSFIDFVGIETFVRTCDRLADQYGERFRLAEATRERVNQKAGR